jgi:hypothetical protein
MTRDRDEVMTRMSMLMGSSEEIISDYADVMISQLHDSLERSSDFGEIRFIQGQIAGIRDFCTVVKE